MDTTPRNVAEALCTSRTRVVRAARRLGIGRRTPGGHWRFSAADMDRLRVALGRIPRVPTYTRTELRVLAALQHSPRGALSARAVARKAGVSPTAAARALARMRARGVARRVPVTVAEGAARRAAVWRLDHGSPRWPALAPLLAAVELPATTTTPASDLPRRFDHLFWNVEPRRLDLKRDAVLVAQRILRSDDLDALAWAARHLPGTAWRAVAEQRRLDPRRRALAANLAAGAGAA